MIKTLILLFIITLFNGCLFHHPHHGGYYSNHNDRSRHHDYDRRDNHNYRNHGNARMNVERHHR